MRTCWSAPWSSSGGCCLPAAAAASAAAAAAAGVAAPNTRAERAGLAAGRSGKRGLAGLANLATSEGPGGSATYTIDQPTELRTSHARISSTNKPINQGFDIVGDGSMQFPYFGVVCS